MSEIKFEDFLLFTEAKSKEMVNRRTRELSGSPNHAISKELEELKQYEVENLKENNLYKNFSEEEQNKVLELVNSIFNKGIDISMETKVEKFEKIAKEMVETYSRKNHDYGDSFGESVKKYGPIAGLVRMSDKWNRLNSLVMGGEAKVKEESIIDTLTDLACYAVMLRMEIESQS